MLVSESGGFAWAAANSRVLAHFAFRQRPSDPLSTIVAVFLPSPPLPFWGELCELLARICMFVIVM